ncbi:TIR domain-containing protein [Erythrobacter mangrovi]|uniref:TIR domain-containing protein n=1 Tax=Erythrobacter mangrovi TaxID=2739433 RepID=A0A7D4BI26_9SPHN|nr:TIR domain-containing protein [Erythrobacter mangrovi]QKG72582.1 TIR domain-containing protein [Erythrobacter mangrovi]
MRGHDIFVSYSREDRNAAKRFAMLLESEGFSVWWDAAIHSGESFDEVIEQKLRAAKAAVVLWSPRSVSSRWVRAEATLADKRHIFVPVIIEKCDLPIIFELTHSTDLSEWDGDRGADDWQRLIADIRLLVAPNDEEPSVPASRARGFLLADDASDGIPFTRRPETARTAANEAPSAVRPATLPQPDSETEQTAFYTRSDAQLHTNSEVHCLEVGPADDPLVRHPIGILGAKLGRAAPSDIIFADKRISRRHCEVEVRDGEMLVTDLQSTNGTFIDGQRIEAPTVLPPNSELMLGDVVLTHRVRELADLS